MISDPRNPLGVRKEIRSVSFPAFLQVPSPFRSLPSSRTKLCHPKFIRGRLYLLHEIKLEAPELHWSSAMKDNVELPENTQLDVMENENTRVCRWFTMRPAPISFLSRSLRKLFVETGIFHLRTWRWRIISVDDNFSSYPDAKTASSQDWNRSHVVMMVMDYLCLSIHFFKSIPVGFVPVRTDPRSHLHEWCYSGQR